MGADWLALRVQLVLAFVEREVAWQRTVLVGAPRRPRLCPWVRALLLVLCYLQLQGSALQPLEFSDGLQLWGMLLFFRGISNCDERFTFLYNAKYAIYDQGLNKASISL